MKRSAFSLIELVFVILILGILSAIAVIKSSDMTDHARVIKLKAFTGTLNRTSGAGFWFMSRDEGHSGSVAFQEYDDMVEQYIEIIPGYSDGPYLSHCNSTGTGVFLRYIYTMTYEIHCRDGSNIESPKFRLYNVDEAIYLD